MSDRSRKHINIHWGWHIVFWMSYYALYCLHYGSRFDELSHVFGLELVELPVKVGFTYLVLYALIPKYLLLKKYWRFTGYLLVALAAATVLQRGMINLISYPLFYENTHSLPPVWDFSRSLGIIARIYTAVLPAAALKAIAEWYQHNQYLEEIRSKKLSTELNYLKSQLNPHFFFNTLNNLYGLILEKSDDAAKVVLQLSDLMSFFLYETNARTIPVSRELKHIENYVELEKLRFGDRFNFSLNVSGNIGHHIAPLLLLPFVENSFKHGVNDEIEQAWMNIDLSVQDSQLTFKIDNSVPDEESLLNNKKEPESGIGLKNVKRRLQLLYPDAHTLKILNQKEVFLVSLNINLNLLNTDV